MLNANDFEYSVFQDDRAKQHAGFIAGQSGTLLLATQKETGEQYIVKHSYSHNAANEYCRLETGCSGYCGFVW